MKGRGKTELAKALDGLTPQKIFGLKMDPKKLEDAFRYDELILEYLNQKHPTLKATSEEVHWGYDFYKRKLNESFKLGDAKSFKPTQSPVVEIGTPRGKEIIPPPLESSEVLLNVDGYVASRTTRGVFWEASLNQRPIELHIGTAADFKETLALRGGKILGEVKTQARNYNPIYLIQYPESKTFHYAITEISGEDRVRHLTLQSSMVRWEGGKGKLAPPPPIEVVGDAAQLLQREEATLTQVLRTLPRADQVVIGQKGAFEKTFTSMAKANSLIGLAEKHPTEFYALLKPSDQKMVAKILQNKSELLNSVMKNSNDWDKIYETILPLLDQFKMAKAVNPTVFDLDRGSYEFSDYVFKDSEGNLKRWRIFSNSWGDEVLPVAKALKATKHTSVVYIGTAGVLPGSDVKVGDLVIPEGVYDSSGKTLTMTAELVPQGAKKIKAVTNVSSPFEETATWLAQHKEVAQAVEVETGHLARVFNGENDRLTTMLLISDAVGVEGETLAEASSSVRRNAQIRALSSVISTSGGAPTTPSLHTPLSQMVNELTSGKDEVYQFYIHRMAQLRDLEQDPNARNILETMVAKHPPFTTGRVQSVLSESGNKITSLLREIQEAGILPGFSIDKDFLNGVWNPNSPLKIHLEITNPKDLEAVKKMIEKLSQSDKKWAKQLSIELGETTPKVGFIELRHLPSDKNILLELYKDSALGFGGLASTQTRTGGLKFVRVSAPQAGSALSNAAYFSPDEKTLQLLKQFKDNPNGKAVLEQYTNKLSTLARDNEFRFVIKEVDHLPAGALAQIVPEYSTGSALDIAIYLTPQGAKNPAVILEEIVHLEQIVSFQHRFNATDVAQTTFTSPSHWAETVANARAGSPHAQTKIMAMELEGIKAAKKFERHLYRTKLLEEIPQELLTSYLQAREKQTELLFKESTKKEQAYMKLKKAEWEKQKLKFADFEKQEEKLNHLIARNDRQGVRKLLEEYLPWPLMEPSEQKAWRQWLEAIEHPDLANRELLFRGLDGDTILRNAEGRPYLMSTVLTKNQGNYTRRLRSLTTMREKIGTNNIDFKLVPQVTEYKGNVTLSTMMLNHMKEPISSPFLSASNNHVAARFGASKRAALLIDKKRILLNSQGSLAAEEFERLIPLIIFPDEILHLEEVNFEQLNPENFGEMYPIKDERFLLQVEEKLGRPITILESHPPYEAQDHFMKEAFSRSREFFLEHQNLPRVGLCTIDGKTGGCDCIFKTLSVLLQ